MSLPDTWRHEGTTYALISAGDDVWRVESEGTYRGLISRAYPVAGEAERSWTTRRPGDEDMSDGETWEHWEDALEALVDDGPTVMGGGIQVFDPDDQPWR